MNPKYKNIDGVRCYPSLTAIPQEERPELALILLPAQRVPEAIRACREAHLQGAIIIASGFEGSDGTATRAALTDALEGDKRFPIIGPNCVGVLSSPHKLYATFSSVLEHEQVRESGIALVTQSGAMGNAILWSLLRRGGGIRHWFSTGDEQNVGALEIAADLLTDPYVKAVGLFVEGFTDLHHLETLSYRAAARNIPVFMVKTATSDLGRIAAAGHTGRTVGSAVISDAVVHKAGIRIVEDIEALSDALLAADMFGTFNRQSVGVVSVSGAGGVMASDSIGKACSLSMFEASHPLENPMDVPTLGDEKPLIEGAISLAEAGAESILLVASRLAHDYAKLTELLLKASEQLEDRRTPLVVAQLSPDEGFDREQIERLASARVLTARTVQRGVAALDRLGAVHEEDDGVANPDKRCRPKMLGLSQAIPLLARYGVPFIETHPVHTLQEATDFAKRLETTVLKVDGRTIAHRADVGAVRINVSLEDLKDAYTSISRLAKAYGDGVVVQAMAPPGTELMVSTVRDPEFGPTVILASGGTLAELVHDQTVLWHGWSSTQRREVLNCSQLGERLAGYRGQNACDHEAVISLCDNLLKFLAENPAIHLVECNPVIVYPPGGGLVIVDVLIPSMEEL